MSSNSVNDKCPHCEETISHELVDFKDGTIPFVCGSCGKKHYCLEYSPYAQFSIFVLSKLPSDNSTFKTLERFPSDEEMDDVEDEFIDVDPTE